MRDVLLSVNDLKAGYGDSRILFGLSLQVGRGEVVTLLGRNGMGKTTTLSTIMGIVPARGGQILFENQPIERLPSFRIAQRGLGLVPEGRQIFPNLTVRENLIATAMRPHGGSSQWSCDAVLDLFPSLRARFGSAGNLLSGGEQQMLAIGRALMTNPKLLILDEATEGLAPLVRAQIWQVLERIKAAGVAILIVDKNVDVLTRIATRHYVIEKGRNVWTGTSEVLRADAEIKRRYLGV